MKAHQTFLRIETLGLAVIVAIASCSDTKSSNNRSGSRSAMSDSITGPKASITISLGNGGDGFGLTEGSFESKSIEAVLGGKGQFSNLSGSACPTAPFDLLAGEKNSDGSYILSVGVSAACAAEARQIELTKVLVRFAGRSGAIGIPAQFTDGRGDWDLVQEGAMWVVRKVAVATSVSARVVRQIQAGRSQVSIRLDGDSLCKEFESNTTVRESAGAYFIGGMLKIEASQIQSGSPVEFVQMSGAPNIVFERKSINMSSARPTQEQIEIKISENALAGLQTAVIKISNGPKSCNLKYSVLIEDESEPILRPDSNASLLDAFRIRYSAAFADDNGYLRREIRDLPLAAGAGTVDFDSDCPSNLSSFGLKGYSNWEKIVLLELPAKNKILGVECWSMQAARDDNTPQDLVNDGRFCVREGNNLITIGGDVAGGPSGVLDQIPDGVTDIELEEYGVLIQQCHLNLAKGACSPSNRPEHANVTAYSAALAQCAAAR